MNLNEEGGESVYEIINTCYSDKSLSSNFDNDRKFWKNLHDELKEDDCISELNEKTASVSVALSKEIKFLESGICYSTKFLKENIISRSCYYYKTVLAVLDYFIEESELFVKELYDGGLIVRVINLIINSEEDEIVHFPSKIIESVVLFLPENTSFENHLDTLFYSFYINLKSLTDLETVCFPSRYKNEINQKIKRLLNFVNDTLKCLPQIDIKNNKNLVLFVKLISNMLRNICLVKHNYCPDEISTYKLLLQVLERLFKLFPCLQIAILKAINKNWEISFQLLVLLVPLFFELCSKLCETKCKLLEDLIFNKLENILINSNLKVFGLSYKEFKKHCNNVITFLNFQTKYSDVLLHKEKLLMQESIIFKENMSKKTSLLTEKNLSKET